MAYDVLDEGPVFLSTTNAGLRTRQAVLAIAAASLIVFVAALPYAKTPLPQVSAFIPIYESALIVNDLITSVLLFGQFVIMRSKAVAVLAGGYLYTAAMAFLHMLTFPGLFSPGGLFGGNAQSTAWIYMFWHGGFPLFVIAYAVLKRHSEDAKTSTRRPVRYTGAAAAAVLALAGAFVLLAILGNGFLPAIMEGSHYSSAMFSVAAATWGLCLIALAVLWRSRPHSTVDIWLMVVLCVWICDIALSVVFNGGRYDLGFYVGRLFGLLAASFVLLALLLENSFLHSRLAAAHAELKRIASADPLTGVANRRTFDTALNKEWRRATRDHSALSLLLIDVDFFKLFNDTYGHVEGDTCLRAVAEALAGAVYRPGDLVARYGGEEFAVLLPQTSLTAAAKVGQRMCDTVAALALPHERSSAAPHVTISVGVASLQGLPDAPVCPISTTNLVDLADRALYQAKSAGRARVSVEATEQLEGGEA